MQNLVIATHNPDKLKEMQILLAYLPFQLVGMGDFAHLPPVEEDQPTILGNAAKKALQIAQATRMLCLADDTGLFIDCLSGLPGVHSARWAGEHCSYLDNRLKALEMLQNCDQRSASFRTVIALASPQGIIAFKEGRVDGEITREELGTNGFGYDSIFLVKATGKTFAQMSDEDKNQLSHRALAIAAIRPILFKLGNME